MKIREGFIGSYPLVFCAAGICAVTLTPASRRSTPSVTTMSPAFNPDVTCDSSGPAVPTWTLRICTVDRTARSIRKWWAVALDRRVRNQDDFALHLDQQAGVDELVGEKRDILVGKNRTQTDGTGGGIDLIVDGIESMPVGDVSWFVCDRARPPPDERRRAAAGGPPELILGDGEDDADRFDLGDHGHDGGIRGNEISGIHQAQADAPGMGAVMRQ